MSFSEGFAKIAISRQLLQKAKDRAEKAFDLARKDSTTQHGHPVAKLHAQIGLFGYGSRAKNLAQRKTHRLKLEKKQFYHPKEFRRSMKNMGLESRLREPAFQLKLNKKKD